MWAAIVMIVIALLLVLAAPKPKVENARAANLGDFQFPRSKEGDPVPWFLGRVRLKSPNSLWYGDYTPYPIKKKQKTGIFSSKKVIVGYKYHVGLDLCWALGGGDTVELLKMWSDKYVFFEGSISTQTSFDVNLPELFGGEEQRGGLVGTVDFYPGRFIEERNAYLADKASPDVPAYVGQCRTVFRGNSNTKATGFYFGTTSNVNAINAEVRRLSRHVHPVYSVMPNGDDVNPMELLYAGFTDRFGMPGLSTDNIDMPSWQVCAERLYNEGFGMSLLVQQSITGKDLCEEVMRIADGILFQDDETGKIVAKLIRNDYDIETLPVFNASIVKELTSFNKTTWDQTYNQCRVTFKDRSNEYADKSATAQDFANINYQQKVRNVDIKVPGCFVNDEATNLATRQLALLSVPLYQIEIRCNRKASLIKPGDLFIFEYEPYGVANMVMRVQRVDKGLLTDGVVTINAVQDRFASTTAVFAPPTSTGWTPISNEPAQVVDRRIDELPYWFSQFAVQPPADNQGMLNVAAAPPGHASVQFSADITLSSDATWAAATTVLVAAPYYGLGHLVADYPATAGFATGTDSVGFTLENVSLPSELVDEGGTFDATGEMMFLVGDEFMSPADLVNNGDGTYSCTGVRRALLDTGFEDHLAGDAVYLVKQSDNILEAYVNDAATWKVRLIDITPMASLDPTLALSDTVAMTRRMFRPAPPDYTQLNGSRTPADQAGTDTTTVTWRERNRKTATLVQVNDATETPEAGTDYQLRWRVNGGAWTSLVTAAVASYVIPAQNTQGTLDVEVYSRRDGLLSRIADTNSVQLVSDFRVLENGTDFRITESGDFRILE